MKNNKLVSVKTMVKILYTASCIYYVYYTEVSSKVTVTVL